MFYELIDSVVCVVTPNGDIIGKLLESSETSLLLESPRGFMQTEKGFGFLPSVSVGCAEVKEARYILAMVLTVTAAHPEIEKAWRQATTGLITP